MKDIKFKDGYDLFNYRVAAVIESNSKYLFQKMPNDTNYTLVGGRVRFMETTKEALIREVLEEVGHDYKDADGVIHKVQTLLFIYKVNISEESNIIKDTVFTMQDKDGTTLHWLSYDEAKKASILPSIAKRLLQEDSLQYEVINDCKYEK